MPSTAQQHDRKTETVHRSRRARLGMKLFKVPARRIRWLKGKRYQSKKSRARPIPNESLYDWTGISAAALQVGEERGVHKRRVHVQYVVSALVCGRGFMRQAILPSIDGCSQHIAHGGRQYIVGSTRYSVCCMYAVGTSQGPAFSPSSNWPSDYTDSS